MSGRDDLGDMTPEEIADWAARDWAAAKEAHKDDPLPEFNRAKQDDHPHWNLVAYMFHTRAGERVLVDRGDGVQVEGTLGRASTRAGGRAAPGRARGHHVGLHPGRRRAVGSQVTGAGCGSRR